MSSVAKLVEVVDPAVLSQNAEYKDMIDELGDMSARWLTSVDEELTTKQGNTYTVSYPLPLRDTDFRFVDASRYLVRYYQFANGNGAVPAIHNRVIATVTQQPVIGKPSPSMGVSWHTTRCERAEMASGDFSSVHEKTVRDLTEVAPSIGKVGFLGWSQAGTLLLSGVPRFYEEFDVTGVVAGDATNAEERRVRKIFGDFGKAGWDELFKEVEASRLPALMRAQGFGKKPPKIGINNTLNYAMEIFSHPPTSLAIARGLGKRTLPSAIEAIAALPEGVQPVTMPYGENSAIMREAALFDAINEAVEGDIAALESKLELVKIKNGTHASADNLFTLSHLAARAA